MAMSSNSLNYSYVTQKEKTDKNAISKIMMKEELRRRKKGLLLRAVSMRMTIRRAQTSNSDADIYNELDKSPP
ncbi:hypothetical protein llap_13371 [Limosa lapponica baueri]|uniref:Uncharacterized protein n=1 Tax=Limosa lapponica baueri TaxID=1758121 RepID=A0A2I0TR90_LIMLA|nr:hypothetical protein llap_13371 [Limosa lapponica baueri]